jgi:integrase
MPVYKDRDQGTYYVSFHYEDWTGKNVRKMKRGFKTKKEAANWEDHFKEELSGDLDMTFGNFWNQYEEDVRPKLRENTWRSKQFIVEKKILPYFKDLNMRDITVRTVIKWQNSMRRLETRNGSDFSETYLRTMQAQLCAIMNHAVKYYGLRRNVAALAGPMGKSHADEMQFWTREEYLKFIPAVANKPYSYISFELLYWCGIRLGELLALTPSDFDFDKCTLSITKSYQRLHGKDVITKPKTEKGIRVITMPKNVAVEVEDFLDSIYGIGPNDRIFTLSKSYLHHEMDRGVKASGVKRIRIHDLRHSHVSLLIDMGYSAVAIAKRMGHESQNITLRYAHMMPSAQDDMAEDLDDVWKEGLDVSEES